MVPVINAHKMAMFCMTGQSEFDSVHFPYFYRLVPPDLEESYAMVAIAQELHYKRIALAFGNDIGSQTFIQPAIAAIKKAGHDRSPPTRRSTSAPPRSAPRPRRSSPSHPDAIMTEALGSADPTLFAEIKQLNGGKMIPVIGTSAAISPPFFKSAAAAVGACHLRRPTSTPTTWSRSPAARRTRRSPRRCWRSRARCPARPATSPPT